MSVGLDPSLSGGLMMGGAGALCAASTNSGCGYGMADSTEGLDTPICTAPPGGPNPNPPPGPGSRYSVGISVQDHISLNNLGSVPITCQETGVTVTPPCSGTIATATFYLTAPGTYTFTAPASAAENCFTDLPVSQGGGSTSVMVPASSSGIISVTL